MRFRESADIQTKGEEHRKRGGREKEKIENGSKKSRVCNFGTLPLN